MDDLPGHYGHTLLRFATLIGVKRKVQAKQNNKTAVNWQLRLVKAKRIWTTIYIFVSSSQVVRATINSTQTALSYFPPSDQAITTIWSKSIQRVQMLGNTISSPPDSQPKRPVIQLPSSIDVLLAMATLNSVTLLNSSSYQQINRRVFSH